MLSLTSTDNAIMPSDPVRMANGGRKANAASATENDVAIAVALRSLISSDAIQELGGVNHVIELARTRKPLNPFQRFYKEERARLLDLYEKSKKEDFIFKSTSKRKHERSDAHGKLSFKQLTKHVCLAWETYDRTQKEIMYTEYKVLTMIYKNTFLADVKKKKSISKKGSIGISRPQPMEPLPVIMTTSMSGSRKSFHNAEVGASVRRVSVPSSSESLCTEEHHVNYGGQMNEDIEPYEDISCINGNKGMKIDNITLSFVNDLLNDGSEECKEEHSWCHQNKESLTVVTDSSMLSDATASVDEKIMLERTSNDGDDETWLPVFSSEAEPDDIQIMKERSIGKIELDLVHMVQSKPNIFLPIMTSLARATHKGV